MKQKIKNIILSAFLFVLIFINACSLRREPQGIESSNAVVVQKGTASVYADKFHGRETASGETFDQNKLTAASKTLPLGSEVEVVNKKSGKKAKVKITDRGPYVKGRVIDLSKATAERIGVPTDGLGEVEIHKVK